MQSKLPKHEKIITSDELREILGIPPESEPGNIRVEFIMPAGHWLVTWTDYATIKY